MADADESALPDSLLTEQVESKNLKAALNFLQMLDPSGFLCSVADPTKTSPIYDESLTERNLRIVCISICKSLYIESLICF